MRRFQTAEQTGPGPPGPTEPPARLAPKPRKGVTVLGRGRRQAGGFRRGLQGLHPLERSPTNGDKSAKADVGASLKNRPNLNPAGSNHTWRLRFRGNLRL